MEQQLTQLINEIITQISTPERLLTYYAGTLGTITLTQKCIKFMQQNIGTKLIRKKLENCKIIDKTPEITHLKTKISNIEKYPQINEIVTKFKNTLESKLTEEQMNIVRKNLETLQYKPKGLYNNLRYTIHGIGGFYTDHYITFNPLSSMNINHILEHELLHASTSSMTKTQSFYGFHQEQKKSKKELGRAINEGYTELLTRRLFGYEHTGYNYEVSVAEMVEFIIGKEKMQDLYFKLDLNGLINELGKYSDINSAKQFVQKLDFINRYSRYNKPSDDLRHTLSQLYNQNSIFLYEAFQNKTNQYLNIDTTSRYFEESNKFEQLLTRTEINNKFNNRFNNVPTDKKWLKSKLSEAKNVLNNFKMTQPQKQIKKSNTAQNINKPKTLVKSKPSSIPNNPKGFIDIITIITLLTITTLLSIGVSYLIYNAR